ncbi:MAG: glycoside hydrolase family 15 protein [Gammaproteobacteria bacterium]
MPDDHEAGPADDAPGAPGIPPTWTSSNKDLVGASLGTSRVWFTLGFGIVNEVYHPRVDIPQIRDLGFIVADGKGFWCEVKRLEAYELTLPKPGIPAPTIVHRHERFELTLRITPDPWRDVLLIEVQLRGDADLKPYVLLAPHLGGTGVNNVAGVGMHYGRKVLWAEQGPFALALAAADQAQGDALERQSAGYVGFSDGWQDFNANGVMKWTHARAGPGNVALLGELARDCVVALAFGPSRGAAATLAAAALAQPFDNVWREHVAAWDDWHTSCHDLEIGEPAIDAQFAISRMVLRCHIDKTYPGAMVASLSIPWGNSKDDRGGYHLIWPRDLVECASALLCVGGEAEARDVLRCLIATQHEDGHWNQNQWLGGEPFWQGVQLDETALPVILAALLHERDALHGIAVTQMVRRALGFITRMGPVTDQDRWEENRGINAFTLAMTIAALVAGTAFLTGDEKESALELADYWNACIEPWLYVQGTPLAKQAAVDGHYIRTAPPEAIWNPEARHDPLPLKNRGDEPAPSADAQVSTDFLQLVRWRLRPPDHACVLGSIAVVDRLLRVETPNGSVWRRYNGDGYGEHADGHEFDGTGTGRAWPLLTGERGHYELLAGNDPLPLLRAMSAMTGPNGMLPEQVWDAEPIPSRGLYPGKPTGSAMPLAWTHAEFIKLALSRQAGKSVDCPQAVFERYRGGVPLPRTTVWSERAPVVAFDTGSDLRVNVQAESVVSWRTESGEWQEIATQPGLPGVHSVVLPTRSLASASRVELTWRLHTAAETGATHTVFARTSG